VQFEQQDCAALSGLENVALVYEDDLMNAARQQATAEWVLAAVGLPPQPVRTSLCRIGGFDLSDLPENFDEIADALAAWGITWANGPRRVFDWIKDC
jgi:hypothetical protein